MTPANPSRSGAEPKGGGPEKERPVPNTDMQPDDAGTADSGESDTVPSAPHPAPTKEKS